MINNLENGDLMREQRLKINSNFDFVQEQIDSIKENNVNVIYKATLLKDEWSTKAPYTQKVTVTGMNATDVPHVTPDYSLVGGLDAKKVVQETWSNLSYIESGMNSITFYALEMPTIVDIPLFISVVRQGG